MRCFLIIMALLVARTIAMSQPSDVLVLKKNGKTRESYYAGSQIEFNTVYGAYRNALITRIYNDTIFLQEFMVRQIPTTIGTVMLDTAGSFRYSYHYKDIYSFGPKKTRGFNLQGSGLALISGGVLLLLANGVVYLTNRSQFSGRLTAASAGLAAAGFAIYKLSSTSVTVGKRGYSLEYIDMTP